MTIDIETVREMIEYDKEKEFIKEVNRVKRTIEEMIREETGNENELKIKWLDDEINEIEFKDKIQKLQLIKKIGYDLIIEALTYDNLNKE